MDDLYKICAADEWDEALKHGTYAGSAFDQTDGFIHLSALGQVRETARRHFAGREGLVIVAFPAASLSDLRWEASRGGALFPHVYGVIPVRVARWVKPLPLVAGEHRFPEGFPA